MYKLLPFLLWASFSAFAQIDTIPPEGVLLNKGWKWHKSDQPEFAQLNFNDSNWKTIDPTKDIHDFAELFDSQIRWLRLTFKINHKPTFPLGLSVNQATGSEVYLNGKLLERLGQLSPIHAQDPLDSPFYIPIDSAGTYELAVRLAIQPRIHYTRLYALTQNNLFSARLVNLVTTQNAQRQFRVYYTGLEIFKIGLLFMLFVLHLAFYLYEKDHKTHLLLTAYFFGAFMQYVFKIIGQNHSSVEARYWYLNLSIWSSIVGAMFAMWAFYKLSKTKFDHFFTIAVFSNLIGGVLSTVIYGMLWSILSFLNATLNFLVVLRLTRIGLKAQNKGFIILGVAVMLSSLGFIFIELLNQNVPISPYVVDLFFNLSAIAIPVGLSLYMGIEASERNKELQARWKENDELKELSIAQEKEKQQILASQNETLEQQVLERTAELKQKNHELVIEASLERVRARALAMQHSNEVLDVANTLYQEVQKLGFEYGACTIQIMDDTTGNMEHWVAGFKHLTYPESYRVNYFAHPCYNAQFEAWRSGQKQLVYTLAGDEKKAYDVHMFEHNEYRKFPAQEQQWMRAIDSVVFSMAFMKHGALHWGPTVLSEEQSFILQRFAAVFEQAYTRFLDLQLKEHQSIKLIEEKQKLEFTLAELKSTQAQLIQKEKLASLGELTAGIAHEIQNPLNFVNNFSELSIDLAQELKEEIEKAALPEKDKEYIEEILADLTQNQKKINHHGKRASSIVKGMLEHSRMGTGERQPTDINALCDEYLRLSFHGMRAKDKAFNADFQIHLDPTLSKINIVPQDIGRVLLNLFNNAFYAVNQRNTVGTLHATSLPNPTVSVQTKRIANAVEIKVSDNGNGIPNDILPKIFQPFFTTKPTGEGTGLGLSLAYDIVTKGYGGTLKVESEEGSGSEFTIRLPLKTNQLE